MKEYDFVVIGSGIAGLTFALKAAKHGSVAVITKRKGVDSNTAWAQGGIACVTSDEDSFELHVADTIEAGAGLCDEAAVRTIVMEVVVTGRSGQEGQERQGTDHYWSKSAESLSCPSCPIRPARSGSGCRRYLRTRQW